MSQVYIENETFRDLNGQEKGLEKGDYENCTFIICLLANGNLSQINFVDCEFVNSDLSTAKLTGTGLKGVKFKGCKLLGLRFEHCSEFLFSVNFEKCQLNLSSFFQRSLRETNFNACNLREVDFAESDLTAASFVNCDLEGAIFENTILEQSDFRTSFSFSIDPESNSMNKAKFSLTGVVGLLGKYNLEIE